MRDVEITSFGYLHGDAPEAHITLDLRHHFRDPHVNPALKHMTAHDDEVRDAVLNTDGIRELISAACLMVHAYQLGPQPGPVTVAVGCAGGRHRAASVAMALSELTGGGVFHRDLHLPVVER